MPTKSISSFKSISLTWGGRIHRYCAQDLDYRGTVSLSVSTDYMYKLYVQIIILSVQIYIERL